MEAIIFLSSSLLNGFLFGLSLSNLLVHFAFQDGVRFYIYFDSDYELDADSVEEKNKVSAGKSEFLFLFVSDWRIIMSESDYGRKEFLCILVHNQIIIIENS